MSPGRAPVARSRRRGLDGDPDRAAPRHPLAVCAVAAALLLAFLAQWWAGAVGEVGGEDNGYAAYLVGGLHAPSVRAGEAFRVFTAPLLHLHLPHFLLNLAVLMGLGGVLESLVGHARYLLVLALSALSGSLAAVALPPAGGVLAGSSGATLGTVGAIWVLGLRERDAPLPLLRRIRRVLPICLLLDSALVWLLGERVGWIAHLGGLAGGMGAMALTSRGAGPIPLRPCPRWMRVAAAGLLALFLCAVAVDVQRIASGRVCQVIAIDGMSEADREGFERALRELPVACAGRTGAGPRQAVR